MKESIQLIKLFKLPFACLFILTLSAYAQTLPEGMHYTKDTSPDSAFIESWTVSCPYQEGENKIEVLLPDKMEKGKHYPVVYILPVNEGIKTTYGHPLSEACKNNLQNKYQCIIVCPAFTILPWYGNNPNKPTVRQNQYVMEVLLPLIDKEYPTISDSTGRYLIGFSKSALGAFSLFFNYPQHFNRVAIFDNYFGKPSDEQWLTWGFAACYGTRANFDTYDMPDLIKAKGQYFQKQQPRISIIYGGPGLRIGVEELILNLQNKNIPITITRGDFGHTWKTGWLPYAFVGLAPDRRE